MKGTRTAAASWRTAVPPVLILALAAGYLGAELLVGFPEPVAAPIPAPVAAALIFLQAVALLLRQRTPTAAFALVVVLDCILLQLTGGELGAGALAVMIATYSLLRDGQSRTRHQVLGAAALATLVIGGTAMWTAGSFAPAAIVAFAVARPLLQYAVPAALAEFFLSREKLVTALRDRADLAARERAHEVERELTQVRTAMARELHDIAAHHLSGIIVGAQAASALITTEPDRSRQLLRTVQQDARTTLADLRRTVGLLRSDEDHGSGSLAQPPPLPALKRVPALVHSAQGRGQLVDLRVDGDPRRLGPLAETAGYRMVQESLANAARHAPGAVSDVHIQYLPALVRITVHNGAAQAATAAPAAAPTDSGYGISGMQERADLVGGQLSTARLSGGGWRNVLEIPLENDRNTQ